MPRRQPTSDPLNNAARGEAALTTRDDDAAGLREAAPYVAETATPGDALTVAEPQGEWSAPRAIAYSPPSAAPAPTHDMSDPDLPYWLAFNRVKGVGPARFKLLLTAFGSARLAWEDSPAGWRAAGLDTRTVTAIETQRRRIVPDAELERLIKLRVGVLRLVDAQYPRLLREIPLPPPLLYIRGVLQPEDDRAVAVVGTRSASAYGRQVTARLAEDLARQGLTIVSGLARGIDTIAHSAALDADGRTIAVLGCGPELVYPPENAKLAARIIEHGCIITEYAPGTQPEAGNFPARNRLISGIALATLVTECGETSGALITARFAGEQGRDVFAVPGNITNKGSVGANRLLQDGASLVLDARDVYEGLNPHLAPFATPASGEPLTQPPLLDTTPVALERPEPRQRRAQRQQPTPSVEAQAQLAPHVTLPENAAEAQTLAYVQASATPQHIDDICRGTGQPIASVSGSLVMLELRGLVTLVGPMTYTAAT